MAKKKIEIIYQNPDILVINKPAGISVTKDRSGCDSITDILAGQLNPGADEKLLLVHRLDKFTSGVMVLAKNTQTQSRLSGDFAKRLVHKTYLAIVSGFVEERCGRIELPIAHCKNRPQVMVVSNKRGKDAITNWRLLADFGSLALLAVWPVTGRTHQIRVHLKNVSMPLAIDPLYGSTAPVMLSEFKPNYRLRRGRTESPLIDRLTLHAYQLKLHSPGGEPECFIAGLDKKFAAAVKMLTKYNPKGPAAFLNPEDFDNIVSACRF